MVTPSIIPYGQLFGYTKSTSTMTLQQYRHNYLSQRYMKEVRAYHNQYDIIYYTLYYFLIRNV
jgi:hypothetical protein